MARLRKLAIVTSTVAVAGQIARAAIDECRTISKVIGGIGDATTPAPPSGSGTSPSNVYYPKTGELVILFRNGVYTPSIAPVPAGYTCTYDPTRAVITSTGTYIGPIVCS